MANALTFLLHWAITAFALWLASLLFKGLRFRDTPSLVISALLLGLANAIVRPVLIVLTLPITFVTFGLFLLVINAVMLLLVAKLVRGFTVSGFWTALFASLFVSVVSLVLGALIGRANPGQEIELPSGAKWVLSPLRSRTA
ncbi:MAG TPA: phage holin family protein [Ramlibacter sp.]|uniref:phage holin family protein n=1 Tax=Ramlibacter sp. TaxID=1917967 RepID=UPI002BFC8703|nr:phage holin family protein [Ramlibacter sp.]HVZ46070.1 phage holin family protein [Ramlibacter sp.]